MTSSAKRTALITFALLAVLQLAACSGNQAGVSAKDAARVEVVNEPLTVLSTMSLLPAYTPALTLVANVRPPTVNGSYMQVTDAEVSGVVLQVSYNMAGATSGGGIDTISLATPALPVLSFTKSYTDLDVNYVHNAGGKTYLAGNSSDGNDPSLFRVYNLDILGLISTMTSEVRFPAYAATAMKADSQLLPTKLYAITGNNGGFHILNPTTLATLQSEQPLNDARDLAVGSNGHVFVVSGGSPGYVTEFSGTGGTALKSVSIGNTSDFEAKSTIVAGTNYVVATAGAGGTKFICNKDISDAGAVVGTIPAPTGGTTNGAAFAGGLVFTADGDRGVRIFTVNQGASLLSPLVGCNALTFSLVGTIGFNDYMSANSVVFNSGFLIVGAGSGGSKIISVTLPLLTTGLLTIL